MDDGEVIPEAEAPAWMLALEKKRQRTHKLAHEVGAGSPCLICGEACPGLDLHFWRKICRNCKCKKEDHDVIDEFGYEQFEILLGAGLSKSHPKKAFLELLEKKTSSVCNGQAKRVAFDWVPPNVSPDIAAEYMQSLPSNKLPISGSDGALYRRQQLERQLPLHDLDANHCHQLTDNEVENLKKYLENLQNNVVGQGRISKYGIPVSKSAESLQNLRTFNRVPKPFRAVSALSPNSIGKAASVSAGSAAQTLKPPSAFLPRIPSPDLSKDADLPSVADRGALFGVTLSPSSRQRKGNQIADANKLAALPIAAPSSSCEDSHKHQLNSNLQEKSFNSPIAQNELNSNLVKNSIPNLVAHSGNVPGSLWIPQECSECSQKAISGKLVSDRVCSHVSRSNQLSHIAQVGHSSSLPIPFHANLPLIDKNSCGNPQSLDQEKSCVYPEQLPHDHGISVTSIDHQVVSSEANFCGQPASPQTSFILPRKDNLKSMLLSDTTDLEAEPSQKVIASLPKEFVSDPMSPQSPLTVSVNEPYLTTVSGVPLQEKLSPPSSSTLRSTSPSSGVGSPHVLALYAHNALLSPSSLDPQDRLSPHLASMALDDASPHDYSNVPGVFAEQSNTTTNVLELQCTHCLDGILPGEVVVYADRAGPSVVWHPKCFVCNTCQELLVDLVYFFSKGQVYCGRHFAELLDIPRCSACDELIFVKEYTVAEGQAFHVKHFCCFECDEALGGKQYVPKDGQPVCLPCYEKKYGKTCETCRSKIGARDQGVTWKNLHWHAKPECFCCSSCHKSLLGGRFAVKELKPFCSKECMQSY